MRTRLRPAYTPEELEQVYPRTYNSTTHVDHLIRVEATAAVGSWFTHREAHRGSRVGRVADLSCGDRAVATALWKHMSPGETDWVFGDLVYSPYNHYTGPIEQTIEQIPPVDLFILSETLEHLDDPDAVLHRIRVKTRFLLLSTPIGETGTDNPEHYWGWDVDGVAETLARAGFNPLVCNRLELIDRYYDFQIWACQ